MGIPDIKGNVPLVNFLDRQKTVCFVSTRCHTLAPITSTPIGAYSLSGSVRSGGFSVIHLLLAVSKTFEASTRDIIGVTTSATSRQYHALLTVYSSATLFVYVQFGSIGSR